MSDVTDAIVGVDADLGGWLSEHVPATAGPFTFKLISGGRSNLTFEVVDANGRRFVLRRPPLGHVLESAHDMSREHRIITALEPTAVPVATPIAFCGDPAVNGAPFYVMEFVDGAILRTEEEVERAFDEDARGAIARSLIDVLATLHAIDPDEVGLGGLGRKDGYVERQLRRWYRQWQQSQSRAVPAIEEVHRRLEARVPSQQRPSIVHGDYRIDNCVIAGDGSVRAVLDWELCTLGDPLADVGLLMVYWVSDGEEATHLLTGTPTALPGFPERAALLERYAARTGADLSQIDFYVALGYWKLACIAEGIYARYRAGVMGEDATPAEQFAHQVTALADAALLATERLP